MPHFEQLRDDILNLPPTAQHLVVDFVAFLKQRYSQPEAVSHRPSTSKMNHSSACGAFEKHLRRRLALKW